MGAERSGILGPGRWPPSAGSASDPAEPDRVWPVTKIVIIGGGPAGYEAALVAVQYGADVTLIEREGIGGACVLSDCVPSKTFIATAGGRTAVLAASNLGVMLDPDDVAVDVAVVNGRVADLALAQSTDIRASLLAGGVQILDGSATVSYTH